MIIYEGGGGGGGGAASAVRSVSFTLQLPGSAEDTTIAFTNLAGTVTEVRAVLVGSASPSVSWNIYHGTDRSGVGTKLWTAGKTTTSITSGDNFNTFDNAAIAANSFLWFKTSAKSGTVNEIHLTFYF